MNTLALVFNVILGFTIGWNLVQHFSVRSRLAKIERHLGDEE